MKLETVFCGLCGSTDAEALYQVDNSRLRVTDKKFWLQRCRACGLVYTSPRPVSDEMPVFYREAYYAPEEPPLVEQLNHFFAREQVRYAQCLKPSGRVLDIGCGSGSFLGRMAEAGFDVQGVEPSASAEERMPERIRERVYWGTLESSPFPEQSFDLITLWHVLEHVPKPLETLRQAKRLLKRDGILLVEVPNFAGLEARWLRRHWFALDVPRHYWHFTPVTLRTAGEESGFGKIATQASFWNQPTFMLKFLFSSAAGCAPWARERFGRSANASSSDAVLKLAGIPACLLCRLWPQSLPTLRMIGHSS